MEILYNIFIIIFFSSVVLFFYHLIRGVILLIKKKFKKSEIKIAGIFFILLSISYGIFSTIAPYAELEALEKHEKIKLAGELESLSPEAITFIEDEVIPQVSSYFDYEEVIYEFNENQALVELKFIITTESFGGTVSEMLYGRELANYNSFEEDDRKENQMLKYNKIVYGIEDAYRNMQDNFDNDIRFQFSPSNYEVYSFISVTQEFGLLSSTLQETLYIDF